MAKQKYYVVWAGRQPGIYTNWEDCKTQTDGFEQARFKAFMNRSEAERAYREGWQKYWGKGNEKRKEISGNKSNVKSSPLLSDEIDYDSISVDVGTRGNPVPVEYQRVYTRTTEVSISNGHI